MKKIEAIGRILGTNKVAYNTEMDEAMGCGNNTYIMQYIDGATLYKLPEEVDNRANLNLLSENWKVTIKDYDTLEDFNFNEFPLSIKEAKRLLIENDLHPIPVKRLTEYGEWASCPMLIGVDVCRSGFILIDGVRVKWVSKVILLNP